METLPEDSTAKSLLFRAISHGTTEDIGSMVHCGAPPLLDVGEIQTPEQSPELRVGVLPELERLRTKQ